MKLERHDHRYADKRVYVLTIDGGDLMRMRMRLDRLDRALLDDVNSAKDMTISDQLLALEMMARRIEEAERGN